MLIFTDNGSMGNQYDGRWEAEDATEAYINKYRETGHPGVL